MRILPAILTEEASDLEVKLRQAEAFTDWVQIDIMDGVFVPSRSIGAEQLAAAPTKLNLEVHLMVMEPQRYIAAFKRAGARRVVIHYEATKSLKEAVAQARGLGLAPGLALNPETPTSVLEGLKDQLDFVLLLSVHPGYYGREFIPQVLNKVAEVKRLAPSMEVGMDGGIKGNNIRLVQASGLDYVCVGSTIFAGDPAQNFLALRRLIKQSRTSERRV